MIPGLVGQPGRHHGNLATAQADVPLVLQIASVTGAWGVDFLVLLMPTDVAALLTPEVAIAARWRTGVLTAVVVALALGYGAVRLSNDGGTGPLHRVAVLALCLALALSGLITSRVPPKWRRGAEHRDIAVPEKADALR